jgi:FkbH-like protein
VLGIIRKLVTPPAAPRPDPPKADPAARRVRQISLPENVKLVIWDLDDTFWKGTLSEGPITPIQSNIDIVKTLAERGIISSICSKNEHADAQAKLEELGVWDYFIFPKIEFGPKGDNIADIIETAGLRAQNSLFIDDNTLNLAEARHVCPGIMAADPRDILPTLLDLPQLAGKPDPELSRLKQYKTLEQKSAERAAANTGNEDFLRQCDVRVEIDFEVEPHFDRMVELANRANQLNYTKRRLETPEAIETFRKQLGSFGVTAGIVQAADKYGDYGIVGFFVLRRRTAKNRLIHFVFSCRAMNMGIEQYLYERLQKPDIDIVEPVANPIVVFDKVDWITEGGANQPLSAIASSRKLLLLGGCELLQLASMCSSNREEFVNATRHGWTVRFDDPGFILGNRETINTDPILPRLNFWTAEDAAQFDTTLSGSEIIIAALFNILTRKIFETKHGVRIRLPEENLKRWQESDGEWFADNVTEIKINAGGKLDLVARSLDRLAELSPPHATRIALGVNTKKIPAAEQLAADGWPQCLETGHVKAWLKHLNNAGEGRRGAAMRFVFNRFLHNYCEKTRKFHYIDVDAITAKDDVHDPDKTTGKFLPDHLTRRGYLTIATHIAETLRVQTEV